MTDPFDDLLNEQPDDPSAQTPENTSVQVPPGTSVAAPSFGVGDVADPDATQEPEPQAETQPGPAEPDVVQPSPTTPGEPAPEAQPAPEAEKPKAAKATKAKTEKAATAAVTERPDRSESLKRRHREALDKVFGREGADFEVVKEVHLTDGQKFKTPFGNTGRHGWVIRDRKTGEAHTIGASALKIGVGEYKVITPPEPKPRGRKPKADAPAAPVQEAAPAS